MFYLQITKELYEKIVKTSITLPDGLPLEEDIVPGMEYKRSTIDFMESATYQNTLMWRMILNTLVHFNNETNEVEHQLSAKWTIEDSGKNTSESILI